MNEMQLLTWVRGPGLNLAVGIFVLGVLWRLFEIYSLGRKKDLSAPRAAPGASGLRTILRRTLPAEGMLKKAPVTYIAGGVFHIGLAIVVLLFAPHIKLIQSLIGVSWPALPSQFIDLITIVTLVAMLVLLADRIMNPVKRFLSTFEDWFTWTLTFLPLLTGWLAVRHLLLPYTTMLALHIISVELLLVFLPFTKLFHAFTVFGSRWFNGTVNGHKGVAV
ncbi:MAG: respiratory nitrate reductase subunit gamma [Burkholderiaceae bacterium]|nr:respiratory nitrate reductase subunit gamma [Burkholderiaceae bacterium]